MSRMVSEKKRMGDKDGWMEVEGMEKERKGWLKDERYVKCERILSSKG